MSTCLRCSAIPGVIRVARVPGVIGRTCVPGLYVGTGLREPAQALKKAGIFEYWLPFNVNY